MKGSFLARTVMALAFVTTASVFAGCTDAVAPPTASTPPPPTAPPPSIDVSQISVQALNDTATRFPISYGQTANYTIVMGDRGSFEFYQHTSRPEIASGPNQPYLELPGDTFFVTGWKRFDLREFSIPSALLFLEDDDELNYGPLETTSGLLVRRKIRISPEDDVIRNLEVVSNPTSTPVATNVRVTSPSTGTLILDENGDGAFNGFDRYFATHHPNAGAVAILMDGAGADRVDYVDDNVEEAEFEWSAVSVPPGATFIYAHFVRLSPDNDAAPIRSAMDGLIEQSCWAGLTPAEAAAIRNFSVEACPNVVGSAGAAAAGTLTIENLTGGGSATTPVASDGTFQFVVDAAVGDTLTLRHSDGTEASLVVGGS